MSPPGWTCRRAVPEDAPIVAALYGRFGVRLRHGVAERREGPLRQALASGTLRSWLAQGPGGPAAAVTVLTDPEHRLWKIQSLCAEDGPAGAGASAALLESLLRGSGPDGPDVVYTTTRSLSVEQQALTVGLGFAVLGVFPNAPGADRSRLNGLTARFAEGVLSQRRYGAFALHPALEPVYSAARRRCGLAPLAPAPVPGPSGEADAPLLELVQAPRLAEARFRRLRERVGSQHFYPFQRPNAVAVSPEEDVEVFVRLVPEMRFAVIIGERLEVPADPAALYGRVARLLEEAGAGYVEVINDAADVRGVECILRAGFLPCAYFPCLKVHGSSRRDYAVFSRSSEPVRAETGDVPEAYRDYLEAYQALAGSRRRGT